MATTTKYLPKYCATCLGRASRSIVEAFTGHTVEVCKCPRLWNRTTGQTMPHVVFYAGGSYFRQPAGKETPVKLKEADVQKARRRNQMQPTGA